jgi:predicted SprT family Zn-dependent metalloprotease
VNRSMHAAEHLDTIQWIFDATNTDYFSGVIPTPCIRISSRLVANAGYVTYTPWAMTISAPYHDVYGWDYELMDTVQHECIHLYLAHCGKPSGHTREFKRIAAQLGVSLTARPRPLATYRYRWACPRCGREHLSSRRLANRVACRRCCDVYNDGRYDPRFNLILVDKFTGSGTSPQRAPGGLFRGD